jgi:hypothetical protein
VGGSHPPISLTILSLSVADDEGDIYIYILLRILMLDLGMFREDRSRWNIHG